MRGNRTLLHKFPLALCIGLVMVFMQQNAAHAFSMENIREEITAKVSKEVSYKIDEKAEYEIPADTALKINVQKNRFGIAEILIYPQASLGQLWVCGFDADGKNLGCNSRDPESVVGAVSQLGQHPCAAITKWRRDDKTFHVSLIISTDKARNRDELEAAYAVINTNKRIGMTSSNCSYHLPIRISKTDRLAGFIKFWTEVKYNFAFFERMPELNWDQVLVDYLPRVEKSETFAEYSDIMKECAALLKDGHTEYYGFNKRNIYCPPITTRCIAGKAIIEEVKPDDIGEAELRSEMLKANLKPGEEIVRVDGLAVKAKLEKDIYPYICASTPQARDLLAYYQLFQGDYGTTVAFTVKDATGNLREVKLKRTGFVPGTSNEFAFKKIDAQIGYVNIPSFGSNSIADRFDKLADQLQGIKGLIIDLRHNGGGDSGIGERIISHLIDTPLKNTIWKTHQYRPSFRAWGRKDEWYKGEPEEIKPHEKKYFLGPIIILTRAATCSAAEDFTVVMHAGKRATVVGERTNGSTGQPLFIELPLNQGARICTKWDTYPDGREFVGVGVIPDVEIGPTPEDIAAGKDAVLDKGIEVLRRMINK